MDISVLSEDKFSATDWINTNFTQYVNEKTGSGEKIQDIAVSMDFINTYVAKLQLYVQQVNYAVEETSQQLVSSLPRIAQDSKTLQQNVEDLQKRMHNVRLEVETVQKETGNYMSSLEKLNILQMKLQVFKESLQQSDGWGNLISSIEDSFERGDIKTVCDKLLEMQKSLESQKKLTGHAERLLQSEDFKNRMEALASPNIVECFVKGDLSESQKYAHIFMQIDRLTQLQQYYRAVHKTSLQQRWKQLIDLNTINETDQKSQNNQFLSLYYEELLEFCQQQTKWANQVFGDKNVQLPFIILIELLPALEPSRGTLILSLLKNNNDRLGLLQQFSKSDQTFVSQINTILRKLKINITVEIKQQLSKAIYEYFHTFLHQYARLEEILLSTCVDRLIKSQSSLGDTLRHLECSNNKIFDWLNLSMERCLQITHDFEICKLISLLGGILKRFLEIYHKTQRQLYQNSRGQIEQWTILQYSMSLLQYLVDTQNRLQQYERQLQLKLKQLENKIQEKERHQNEINMFATIDQQQIQHILHDTTKYLELFVNKGVIFENAHELLRTQLTETHELIMDIIIMPVETHLLQLNEAANSYTDVADLPAFSLAPNEYVTQIGQYLLMLPQHLEPLLLSPSPLLKQALQQCDSKYIASHTCADALLELIVEKCCATYCIKLLQLKTISSTTTKQLVVDIEYLSNVAEDLGGLTLTTNLSQILKLLKAPAEEYLNLTSGCDPRLVTTIRQMRNIISTQ